MERNWAAGPWLGSKPKTGSIPRLGRRRALVGRGRNGMRRETTAGMMSMTGPWLGAKIGTRLTRSPPHRRFHLALDGDYFPLVPSRHGSLSGAPSRSAARRPWRPIENGGRCLSVRSSFPVVRFLSSVVAEWLLSVWWLAAAWFLAAFLFTWFSFTEPYYVDGRHLDPRRFAKSDAPGHFLWFSRSGVEEKLLGLTVTSR